MPGRQDIEKVSHIHEMIINEMIANPLVTQAELCAQFGYRPSWMSRIIRSDAFQARLAERRQAVMDPIIRQRLNDKLQSVALQSISTIQRQLDSPDASADMALSSLQMVQRALGVINPPKE